MAYWIIIAIAFFGVAYCFSYRVWKKYNIQKKDLEIFGLTLLLLWGTFLLGLYLSACLKL